MRLATLAKQLGGAALALNVLTGCPKDEPTAPACQSPVATGVTDDPATWVGSVTAAGSRPERFLTNRAILRKPLGETAEQAIAAVGGTGFLTYRPYNIQFCDLRTAPPTCTVHAEDSTQVTHISVELPRTRSCNDIQLEEAAIAETLGSGVSFDTEAARRAMGLIVRSNKEHADHPLVPEFVVDPA